jgi:hypothetical protein
LSKLIGTNIKKQVCKPDSVPDSHLVSIIYLVPALLQESISLPPGSGRAVLFANRRLTIPGIFGLSTHKVYPPDVSPHRDVSFYLTFSPLSIPIAIGTDGYFLWPSLSPHERCLPVRKYGALCCPDFPPRHLHIGAIERLALMKERYKTGCKGTKFSRNGQIFNAFRIIKV